jgi:hypothetical protein
MLQHCTECAACAEEALARTANVVSCHVTSRSAQPPPGAYSASRAWTERTSGVLRHAKTPQGRRWARGASRKARPPARADRRTAPHRAPRPPPPAAGAARR